jgi:DUF4097 and DUF4098 domain-containing protein YvlB
VNKLIFTLALVLAAISSPALAELCSAEKTIDKAFAAGGVSLLKVNALAGYLEISATESSEISFTGHACTDEDEWLERMTLDVERKDQTLILTVMIPYDDDDFDARYAYIDVDIALPANLPLEVKDSSGDITISDVSATRVDDSSGNIRIVHNQSSLTVKDSSGDITIKDLKGDAEISDSSGDIDIRQIDGSVLVPRDSSGEIDIETVTGQVTIGSDSSGDIEISDVSADVEIGSDGSGGIKIHDVQGGVRIGSDGSGGVSVTNISGDLLITSKGSGDVRTRGVEGEISLPR